MTRLHLVRHGRSTWNDERRVQGQDDRPQLTTRGRDQAAAAAALLEDRVQGPTRVLSSDLRRALQTAAPVAEALDTEVEPEPRLREQALGDLEGRLAADLRAEPVPEDSHIAEVRWGGGESVRDVHIRCVDLLADLRRFDVPDVVLVGHADALTVLLAAIDGRDHRSVAWGRRMLNGEVRSLDLS